MRPSRHGVPPPVAITSPALSLRLSSVSASSWRNRASPASRKISGIERPSAAAIISSVSTKQRPRRRASRRPQTEFPAPMNPTRITLSRRIPASYQIVLAPAVMWVGGGARRGGSAVDARASRRAAVGALAHPAAGALAEVVIDLRVHARRGQERDGFHGRHEARVVEADTRSEEHTSELQSLRHLVCRLLLEKK